MTYRTMSRCSTMEPCLAPVAEMCVLNKKKENALFNDILNTFNLKLHGIGHMIKDHSDS